MELKLITCRISIFSSECYNIISKDDVMKICCCFDLILITSEDDVMEEDVVVTTPVTPGVSLHYPQVLTLIFIEVLLQMTNICLYL